MIIIRLLSKLPFKVLYILSDILSFFLKEIVRYRKKVILQNLRNSFPEMSDKEINLILANFYVNLSDIIVESIKAIGMSKAEMQKRVVFNNIPLLSHLINNNKSVIILTSHIANWEWGFVSFSASMNYPINAVYKQLSNPFFDKLMLNIRSKFGANMIEKDATLKEVAKRKDEGSLIGLMSDQTPHSPKNRIWLKFLNQDTVFYTGPERIARMMNYAVYYVGLKRIKRGYYEATFTQITDDPKSCGPNEILTKYIQCIEKNIKSSPADYLWSHKRWKHKRSLNEKIDSIESSTDKIS